VVGKKLFWVLGLVVFWNLFLFRRLGTLGVALFFLVGLVFIHGVLSHVRNKKLVVWSVIVAVLLSLALVLTANPFVDVLLMVSLLTELVVVSYLVGVGEIFYKDAWEMVTSKAVLGLAYMVSVWRLVTVKVPKIGPIFGLVRGLVIGVPIALVLLVLMSADPIFYTRTSAFLKVFSGEFWGHLVFSIFALAILLPFAWMKVKKVNLDFLPELPSMVLETRVVLGIVALIMGAFLIVQWPYVFASVSREVDLSRFGVATYSEYVRRGFAEFLAVAVIVYGVLVIGRWTLRKGGAVLQLAVWSEFMIFLVSVFRRISLYQQYHGLSLVRVYGGLFLLTFCGLAITLLLRHCLKCRWIVVEASWILLVVLMTGYLRAENLIARYDPPTVNGRVDYVYLSRMSSDGVAGWLKSYEYASKILNSAVVQKKPYDLNQRRDIIYSGWVLENLSQSQEYLDRKYDTQKDMIFSWNYSEVRAYDLLKKTVGSSGLADLEAKFKIVNERISHQPEGERSVDIDISFSTPFLLD
jgi:hypothetical protein